MCISISHADFNGYACVTYAICRQLNGQQYCIVFLAANTQLAGQFANECEMWLAQQTLTPRSVRLQAKPHLSDYLQVTIAAKLNWDIARLNRKTD